MLIVNADRRNMLTRRSQHDSSRQYKHLFTDLHGGIVAIRVLRRHTHSRVDGRWRRRPVRGAGRSRVVLAAAPGQADARVADRVALHLVNSHFGRVSMHKLYEATSLARRDFDVSDFTKALEERTEFIFSDISREASNKDGGIVGVRELIHGLTTATTAAAAATSPSTIVAHRGGTHRVHAERPIAGLLLLHVHSGRTAGAATLVLGGGSRNAHWAVAAVDALHFAKRLLLILLIGKAHEAIATRHSADGICHDLGRLAGRVPVLEERHENEFGDLRAQVTDEDGELGTTVITAVAWGVSSIHGAQSGLSQLTCDRQDRHPRPSSA
jgi:hypothetical protein